MTETINKEKIKKYLMNIKDKIEKDNKILDKDGDKFVKIKRIIGENKIEVIEDVLFEIRKGGFQ